MQTYQKNNVSLQAQSLILLISKDNLLTNKRFVLIIKQQYIMKLKELFQAYEFDEIYPHIGLMFPKGRHLRNEFRNAYDLVLSINPVLSKKQIRYQLMEDPDTNEMFFGADDHDFNGPWDVLLGKEVKKEPKVDLTDEELVANCLLNTVLIGRHPRPFDKDYQAIIK